MMSSCIHSLHLSLNKVTLYHRKMAKMYYEVCFDFHPTSNIPCLSLVLPFKIYRVKKQPLVGKWIYSRNDHILYIYLQYHIVVGCSEVKIVCLPWKCTVRKNLLRNNHQVSKLLRAQLVSSLKLALNMAQRKITYHMLLRDVLGLVCLAALCRLVRE